MGLVEYVTTSSKFNPRLKLPPIIWMDRPIPHRHSGIQSSSMYVADYVALSAAPFIFSLLINKNNGAADKATIMKVS